MKKARTNRSWFFALGFLIFSVANPTSLAGTSAQEIHQIFNDSFGKRSLFSDWFKNSNKANQIIGIGANSQEIWSRLRTQFHLSAPATAITMQRHLKEYTNSPSKIKSLINNAAPYLYYILEEVEKRGMPSEIALLPMIESEFNPHNISHKGAAGLWQLMPSLGRLHGLKQNSSYDGRRDIYDSTKVALDHLEYLHERFNGNWFLALAAYNSGEARVLSAIKKNRSAKKSTDYWSLPLPKETVNFVPKLLALVTIIKSPKEYGIDLPSIENKPVFTRISTTKAIDISHAAKMVDISENQLRKLNPGLHKKAAQPKGKGPFHLVVPIHQASNLQEQVSVTKNNTPIKTASKKSKPQASKKAAVAPKIATAVTHVKKPLPKDVKIVGKAASSKSKDNLNKNKFHVVKSGESLPSISKKLQIKIKTLKKYNPQLKPSTILHPGQQINIPT
ncbi:MAG: transglycosylase SLT domain-containing protein [Candidatus Berkiellales bacterium]